MYNVYDCVCECVFICTNVNKLCYFSKLVSVNVCDGWAGRFDSSSALCSALLSLQDSSVA